MLALAAPHIDYHALAPEIVLAGVIVLVLLVDLVSDERGKWATSTVAGIGLLGAMVPILTLAVDGADRSMFGGAYVVDNFSLVFKALFLVADSAHMDPATGRWVKARQDSLRGWRITGRNAPITVWVDAYGRLLAAREPGGISLVRTAFEIAFENWRLSQSSR